jgi:hypothetical protein
MVHKSKNKKPGPKGYWWLRARYQRARCVERLKPIQVENLAAADAFTRWIGKPLNCFVTVRFLETVDPKAFFEAAIDRLSKWHSRWCGEWFAFYIWEATGGFHVHIVCHCPRHSHDVHNAIRNAFAGQDVDIRPRYNGQGLMAYICKGTDIVTHAKIQGPRHIKARVQGVITWKRCGTTQNIGKAARDKEGFSGNNPKNNCAETSPRNLNARIYQRTRATANGGNQHAFPTYVVSQTPKTHLQSHHKHGSTERVASGDLDASRHALPDPLMLPDPCASTGL